MIVKKITYALIISLLATLVCSAQPKSSIVGSWVQESKSMRWTFRPDGTGFMERQVPKMTARFKWRLQGRLLKISTAGTFIPYKMIENDGRTLVIQNQHVEQTYKLIKQ